MWSKTPPTYDEWINGDSNGYWWVKFIISEREEDTNEHGEVVYWPEVWYTDCVYITAILPTRGNRKQKRLIARGHALQEIDLSKSSETEGLYWQPVKPPDDDTQDKAPTQIKE